MGFENKYPEAMEWKCGEGFPPGYEGIIKIDRYGSVMYYNILLDEFGNSVFMNTVETEEDFQVYLRTDDGDAIKIYKADFFKYALEKHKGTPKEEYYLALLLTS